MANEYGAFAPLTGGAAYWRTANVTLLEGELAWETPDGGGMDGAYLLRGDGFPANGTPRGDYTRLRADLANQLVSADGKSDTLKHFIETLFARDGDLAALETGAKGSLVSALNEALSLAAAAHTALEAESEERRNADSDIDAKLDSESARALAAESDLSDRVLEEAARAAAEEGALNARADALEAGMAGAALSAEGRYAPIDSPRFTGIPEVPDIADYRNSSQAVPVAEIVKTYDLLSNENEAAVLDTDYGGFPAGYLWALDKESGTVAEYMRIDIIKLNDTVSKDDYGSLYQFVMSVSGGRLWNADGGLDGHGRPLVFKADAEEGITEITELDCGEAGGGGPCLFESAQWRPV
jgi:hypothetical protein